MNLELLIRPFASTDPIPEITRLLHAAYRPLLEQGMRYVASHQDDPTTLRRCTCGETYLAVQEDVIVGTITLKPPEKTKGSLWYDRPDVAAFGQFAVRPDLQNHGIGSRLLAKVESRAREIGAREIALDTPEHALQLIAMYEAKGYRQIETMKWDAVNYRSIILSKRL